MRTLFVGCGAMSAAWLDAILNNDLLSGRIELVGLVDTQEAHAAGIADRFSLLDLPRFSDLTSALELLSPEAVFDVTPPAARASVVRASLRSGAHVLSEKPMASSLAEAKELAALARQENRHFAVTQNRRFSNGIRRIGSFLHKGGLGEVTGLHADFFIGPRFGGFREEMQHVLLLDMAIHTFDGARYLAADQPIDVQCVEVNPAGSWYAHGASAFATFQMASGAVFTYRGSWCSEGAMTSWDASWRVTGTKGTLLWDGEDEITAHAAAGPEAFLRETIPLHVPEISSDRQSQGHVSVIADFLDAIESGNSAETNCEDNLHTISMVFAAIESAKSGHSIDIAQLRAAA